MFITIIGAHGFEGHFLLVSFWAKSTYEDEHAREQVQKVRQRRLVDGGLVQRERCQISA